MLNGVYNLGQFGTVGTVENNTVPFVVPPLVSFNPTLTMVYLHFTIKIKKRDSGTVKNELFVQKGHCRVVGMSAV